MFHVDPILYLSPDLEYRFKDGFQHPCFNPDPHTFYGKGWLLTHYMTPARQFNLSEPQFTQKKFRNVSTYRIIVRLKWNDIYKSQSQILAHGGH